jgi:hypothetical protein
VPESVSVPEPVLVSMPAPEMLAASVSAFVKFATIWPSSTIAGVMMAPARPPVPRFSVLPTPTPVKTGELTTAPSAIVSVPTPQPQELPMASDVATFTVEPAPVTVTIEVPVIRSPMSRTAEFSVPPPETVSAPPRLTVVSLVTVTVEPAPLMFMFVPTARVSVESVPPFVTASVPPSTKVKPPTVNDPPLMVSPSRSQAHNVRSPPILLPAPVNVSCPPSSSSDPGPVMAPENVVVAGLPAPIDSVVVASAVPIFTDPPPARDPMSACTVSAMMRVAPVLTVTAVAVGGVAPKSEGNAPLDAAMSVPALTVVAPV